MNVCAREDQERKVQNSHNPRLLARARRHVQPACACTSAVSPLPSFVF
jgi:hypothetical protein